MKLNMTDLDSGISGQWLYQLEITLSICTVLISTGQQIGSIRANTKILIHLKLELC